jgi:hypothetical protein
MTAQKTEFEAFLHPIATEAGTLFLKGKGSFSKEALGALQRSLEKIADKPELGPALASLVQVAQHLDRDRNAKAASQALLRVAMTQTIALEELNKTAKQSEEDRQRAKRKAFNKFTGRN